MSQKKATHARMYPVGLPVPQAAPAPGAEVIAPSVGRDRRDMVDQVMYWLTAPYVIWPGYEDIYQANDNKTKALVERLAHHKEISETRQCTEFEAMLYISTATLVHPPSHDCGQIYLWLFSRWNPEAAREIEAQPDRPELSSSQQEALTGLRRWIYRVQVSHLKRIHGEREDKAQHSGVSERELQVQRPRLFD